MSEATQEIRASVIWDTSGVDKGQQRVERALDRLGKAETRAAEQQKQREAAAEKNRVATLQRVISQEERMEEAGLKARLKARDQFYDKAKKQEEQRMRVFQAQQEALDPLGTVKRRAQMAGGERVGGHGGGGGRGGHGAGGGGAGRYLGDLINMITGTSGNVNKISGLAHIGLGGLAGAGIVMGASMLEGRIEKVREEQRELDRGNQERRESFQEVTRESSYRNVALGPSGLNSALMGLREQRAGEGQQLDALYTYKEKADRGAGINLRNVMDAFRTMNPGGARPFGLTTRERIAESLQRNKALESEDARLRGERSQAIEHDTEVTRQRGTGSSVRAQQMEIDVREKKELLEAKENQFSEKDAEAVKERFEIERNIIRMTDRAQRIDLSTQKQIAEFRGNAEQRAMYAADMQVASARDQLQNAKDLGTVEERNARKVANAQAEKNRELLREQQAVQRVNTVGAVLGGAVGLKVSAFRASLDSYSQNQNTRFTSGQAGERAEAQGAVARAQLALNDANRKVEIEKKSEASVREQMLAQQGLVAAKMAQLELEKKLTAEAVQRTRQLKVEADAARNQTMAMRIANTGRADRAELFSSRTQTQAQALEYERQGRPEMAAEVLAQQQARETSLFDEKYLRPDGRRRRRSELVREERHARVRSMRMQRANARLEANGGLIDVRRDARGHLIDGVDPITRQRVSAEELYQRKHRAEAQGRREAKSDSEMLAGLLASNSDIKSILEARLPKVTA